MDKLILVSYGQFCNGIKDSLEMILGPQPQILTVPLLEEEGEADIKQKYNDIVNKDDNITVFVDLLGGTPSNVMSQLLKEGQNFKLYTEMSLPMVISYISSIVLGQPKDFRVRAREGVVFINDILNHIDDEDE
ncbi:PTS sugar transporter subunit IIA [Staphylococcus kloosii]|uniref:PTS fructose transporter subunit IIA n=1 Tax=Staphylococcus kloosii TaxID=29384 RepID=A0A921KVI8_9STAP|nr:PTS fructose transporter subunit IIA [Staphylococcus kloosii]MBF7020891.1 PTS fructose transporter subunit IIA [Staphylococcus kloosii]MBF7030158.1 PTS fructose transporter subunit IIA [Staphylococcus kloosii]PTJ78941.1 PTS fructose transporter subunit IIA [Staphylococcus kloosii]HJF67732.1 PTS fructose transporter subunit IIA [Staphylococcus kloosii]